MTIVTVFQMSAATWPALDALVTDAPWAMVCLDDEGNLYNLDNLQRRPLIVGPEWQKDGAMYPVAGTIVATAERLGGAKWIANCRERGWLR